ncbi:MAG: CotH kinase family protein [Gemmataceae bacterium]|nr:CotH kinase family protein [Gemmataceae bacterium]
MQPKGGIRFGPPPKDKPPEKKEPDKKEEKKDGEPAREVHRSVFGMEFPVAHAEFTAEGKTFKNIGLRYKGNASYMAASRGVKRNFKVQLEKFEEDARFHGIKTINLNAGAMDPNKGREALSFAIFRAAGVPAPRTAYAEVTLTVPGKFDKEYLGLYTYVEQVDKPFLKEHFKNGKGLLMKPERLRGLEHLGDDWAKYKDRYQPKDEPSKEEATRVIEFTKLLNKGDDEQFRKQIADYLDIDAFLRYVAVNALLVNLDSFLMVGHNYYLYLNPETNKFVFIPWDLDLSMGGFPMGGTPDQQMDLSVMHPYSGQNKLIDRLFAMKDVSEKYQKLLKELTTTCFTKEKLLADIDVIEKTTKDLIAKDRKAAEARKEGPGGFGGAFPGMGRAPDLRTFAEKRTLAVAAQLEGKSKGYVPTGGFGPRPGGFNMGNIVAKPLLEAVDADKDGKMSNDELVAGIKKFFKDTDKDNKGSLDEKSLAEGLNRIWPPPPGGARPPAGFGPGNFIAGAIMKRAGIEKDGKVTLDKLLETAEALFKEADKDKKGMLDEKAVAAGVGILFPVPPPPKQSEPKKDEPKP